MIPGLESLPDVADEEVRPPVSEIAVALVSTFLPLQAHDDPNDVLRRRIICELTTVIYATREIGLVFNPASLGIMLKNSQTVLSIGEMVALKCGYDSDIYEAFASMVSRLYVTKNIPVGDARLFSRWRILIGNMALAGTSEVIR